MVTRQIQIAGPSHCCHQLWVSLGQRTATVSEQDADKEVSRTPKNAYANAVDCEFDLVAAFCGFGFGLLMTFF